MVASDSTSSSSSSSSSSSDSIEATVTATLKAVETDYETSLEFGICTKIRTLIRCSSSTTGVSIISSLPYPSSMHQSDVHSTYGLIVQSIMLNSNGPHATSCAASITNLDFTSSKLITSAGVVPPSYE